MFYKKLIINDVEYDLAVNITGKGAPTVEGAVGLLYMDENNGDFYKCTAVGVWKKVDDAEAKQKAEEAYDLAVTANGNALDAQEDADDAKMIAREARETAQFAERDASSAESKASDALTYAEDAYTFAKSASRGADNANQLASDAMSEAETAKSVAEAASERVTEHEKTAIYTFANVLKGKLRGANIGANDVSPIEHDLDVKVTAEEIFVFADDFTAQTQNGEVVATVDNGKIVLNGAAGDMEDAITLPLSSLPEGTYEYNINYSDGATLLFQDATNGAMLCDSYYMDEGNCTFTLEETIPIWIGVIISPNRCHTFSDTALDISLKRVVGGEKIYRYGKNLFDNDIEKMRTDVKTAPTARPRCGYVLNLPVGTYTISANRMAYDNSGYIYGYLYDRDGNKIGNTLSIVAAAKLQRFTIEIKEGHTLYIIDAGRYADSGYTEIDKSKVLFSNLNIQIEAGSAATPFEPYIAPEEFVINVDGTVDIKSIAPSMALGTYMDNTTIECTYNRDINIVIDQLTNAIISTGGNI